MIKFCERKISSVAGRRDIADKESYVLLWEMLVLLLRQKGQVEGSDLAELLLRHRETLDGGAALAERSRTSSHRDNESVSGGSVYNDTDHETHVTSSRSLINHQEPEPSVDKFRSYLLHGNKAEGLEYAMKVGLWGHALFLASKMDQRTYAGVMTRFANGLAINDPLQTLYQLMSSRYVHSARYKDITSVNTYNVQDSYSYEAVRRHKVGRLEAAPRHDPLQLRDQ